MTIQRAGEDPDIAVIPPGPLAQRIEIRAGDDLPGFAAVIEDELGRPVDLTGAVAYFVIEGGGYEWKVEQWQCQIINAEAGVVQFDWSSADTRRWWVGAFSISMLVRWPDGRELTAPSDRSVQLLVRPITDPGF